MGMTVRSDNAVTATECDRSNSDQTWEYNEQTRQMESVKNRSKCLTISNYITGQAKLRGCEERQTIFDWQGPNLWWHGYADAVQLLDGVSNNSILLKVNNSNHMCAGLGSPEEINTFAGELDGGKYVTLLLNRDSVAQNITLHWESMAKVLGKKKDLHAGDVMKAYDVYEGKEVGQLNESVTLEVKPHYVKVIELTPVETSRP